MRTFAAVCFAVIALCAVCASRAEASDNPITCRSGGMPVKFEHWKSFPIGSKGHGFTYDFVFQLEFRRSKGAAANGLKPGECAWSDRAVRSSEPNEIVGDIPDGSVLLDASGHVRAVHSGLHPYIDDLFTSSGRLFTFLVRHNTGSWFFWIDKFGP